MDGNTVASEQHIIINDHLTLYRTGEGQPFGTDAVLLAAYIPHLPCARAAEFGSGSGVVSLMCAAREKLKHITAYEITPTLHDAAVLNIKENGFSDLVTPVCIDIRDLDGRDQYDIVFCNPPYIKSGSGKRSDSDTRYIARHEIMGQIGDFCAAASRVLRFGGDFYCVYRPERIVDLLFAMRSHSLEPKRLTYVFPLPGRSPSLILVSARKGAAPSLITNPPLYIYESAGKYSAHMQNIYDTGYYENREANQ